MSNQILSLISNIAKHSDNVSYQNVAKFILENLETISKFSIFDIAKKTSTSPSTITRFCKHIGLDGFKQLGTIIALESKFISYEKSDTNPKRDNNNGEKLFDVITSSLNESIVGIENNIERLKKFFNNKKRIFLFGKGGNIFLIHLFLDWITRIDYNGYFSSDVDQQLAYSNLVKEEDIVLIVSYSLSSGFYEKLFKNIKSKNVLIITKNVNSPLLSGNEIVFKIGNNESLIKKRHNGEITTLFLLKIIFNSLLEGNELNKLIQNEAPYYN